VAPTLLWRRYWLTWGLIIRIPKIYEYDDLAEDDFTDRFIVIGAWV